MLDYDLPRIHAVLNDLPAALLTAAVFFELVNLVSKRDGFRQAGFWTLIVGTVGAGAAVLSGLQAEDKIAHGDAVHRVMETHEEYALITLGVFAVVALWRIVRETKMGRRERTSALILSIVGAGFLFLTGMYGGKLVFEHAAGIPDSVMTREIQNRAEGHSHIESVSSPTLTPGTPPREDKPEPAHTHAPGTPPHKD